MEVIPERRKDLSAGTKCLAIRVETERDNHELLEVRGVFCVLSAVQDVEERHGEGDCTLAAERLKELHALLGCSRMRDGE